MCFLSKLHQVRTRTNVLKTKSHTSESTTIKYVKTENTMLSQGRVFLGKENLKL